MKRILVLLIAILLLTGCSEKPKVISETKGQEDINTKSVDETVSTSKNKAYYDYSTEKYDIKVKLTYDEKKFKLDNTDIKGDNFYITVTTDNYKYSYFETMKEIYADRITSVDGHEAISIKMDTQIILMIKIDNETIISVSAYIDGLYLVDDIEKDEDYIKMIKDIKIDVKKK